MNRSTNLPTHRNRVNTRLVLAITAASLIALLAACQSGGGDPVVVTTPESAPTSTPADTDDAATADQTVASAADTTVTETITTAINDTNITEDTATDQNANTDATDSPELPVFSPDTVTIQLEAVTDGLNQPIFATHAGDGSGRIFIVEKIGVIRILADGQLLATPYLDIQDRVRSSGNEQGLLGLAFAPDYPTSGYFFVNYSDSNGDTVVARFQVAENDPNQAGAQSEFVILQLAQPAGNHNGGMLLFGPDGELYIGTGDGGASGDRFGNGQNPATLLGKMLRIDVTTDPSVPYQIPADNPWLNATWNGADVRDEIWALGLRNPWRYSFDRETGDLWIGDVGQNAFEEINLTRAEEFPTADGGGLNYGWPIMEGQHCYSPSSNCDPTGLLLPVVEYGHQGHCSVTGGYVYRGQQYPVLNGVYFYADYCSGVMWTLAPDGDGNWTNSQILQTGATLSSFGEDEAGELYLLDYNAGTLYQVTGQ